MVRSEDSRVDIFVFFALLSVLSFNTAYGVTGQIVFLKNMGIDSNI